MAHDNHHTRGKLGTLYIDRRFFLPVSRAGHDWIDRHPEEARRRGLLCERGLWNVAPDDAETRRLKHLIDDEVQKIKAAKAASKIQV